METEFGTFVELQLPNMEIRRVYNTEILSWLRGSMEGNAMAEIEKSLYLNDGDRLKTVLQKYMIGCISNFDGAAVCPECGYLEFYLEDTAKMKK